MNWNENTQEYANDMVPCFGKVRRVKRSNFCSMKLNGCLYCIKRFKWYPNILNAQPTMWIVYIFDIEKFFLPWVHS